MWLWLEQFKWIQSAACFRLTQDLLSMGCFTFLASVQCTRDHNDIFCFHMYPSFCHLSRKRESARGKGAAKRQHFLEQASKRQHFLEQEQTFFLSFSALGADFFSCVYLKARSRYKQVKDLLSSNSDNASQLGNERRTPSHAMAETARRRERKISTYFLERAPYAGT